MSNINYGVISGLLLDDFQSGEHPHLFLTLSRNECKYKVAINIESYDGSSVFFSEISSVKHRLYSNTKPYRFSEKEIKNYGVDYILSGIVSEKQFVKFSKDELEKELKSILKAAVNNNKFTVYSYGSLFPLYQGYYKEGIHDIHMNQGYPHSKPEHYKDGAIFIANNTTNVIQGLFFHFMDQKFNII